MLRHFKQEMLKRSQQEQQQQQQQQQYEQTAAMPTDLSTISTNSITSVSYQLAPISETVTTKTTAVKTATNKKRPLKQQQQQQSIRTNNQQHQQTTQTTTTTTTTSKQTNKSRAQSTQSTRNRRASKPQMEKRRRARINECLDILKSYVLTDSTNLSHLGIDPAASENQDEETIARTILKSSGLIYRHKGRKNPNKLEKADILELTVDYVRRLYEQRNKLLHHSTTSSPMIIEQQALNLNKAHQSVQKLQQSNQINMLVVPAHLSEPLTLDLSPKSRQLNLYNNNNNLLALPYSMSNNTTANGAPPTPPPSSASSIQSSSLLSDDLSSSARVLDNYKLYDMLASYQQQMQA